jgi:hypothetical protein
MTYLPILSCLPSQSGCSPAHTSLSSTTLDDATRWQFIQKTKSGRSTFTLLLPDLPIAWQDRVNEGSIVLGWQDEVRAYHVSAKGLLHGPPQSFLSSMHKSYTDQKTWLESYLEELYALREQDTYFNINAAEYENNYQGVQIIPTMCVCKHARRTNLGRQCEPRVVL